MSSIQQPDFLNQTQQQTSIEAQIRNTIASHVNGEVINLVDVTDFDWEEVYVFGGNTSARNINETLGINWILEKDFYVDELADLLVFVSNQQVVEYVLIRGDIFVSTSGQNKFLRSHAQFRLIEVNDINRPKALIVNPG